MAVVASATGAAVFGLSGVAAGLAGGALLGAGAGALYSGITGDGNILDSALTGALLGGAVGGIGAAFAPAGATTAAGTNAALAAETPAAFAYNSAGEMVSSAYSPQITGATNAAGIAPPSPMGIGAIGEKTVEGLTGGQKLAAGLAGTTALSMLGGRKQPTIQEKESNSYIRPYTYSQQRNPNYGLPGESYFTQSYEAQEPYKAARGGIMRMATGGAAQPVVPMQQLAAPVNTYGAQRPVAQAVTDYNQLLAQRAQNEYNVQPAPLSTLPGGGERAGAADTQKIINQYYLSNLGRQGDQPGLDYFTNRKMTTGESLADIQNLIKTSPEAIARQAGIDAAKKQQAQATLEADPQYKKYMSAPITAENFDEADYIARNPDAFQDAPGRPYQHYLEANRTGDIRTANKRPFQQKAVTSSQSGYTYNPVTKQFTAPTPATAQADTAEDSSGIFGGMDPNVLKQMYTEYVQRQQSSGGGAAGGLMPSSLKYAMGGDIQSYNLGGYSDGGRLLRGPGDGVSDDIPATIGNRQPARLADGEFVIPARIVSELGNGSTDAGAKRLYAMMDRIQAGRKKTVGKGNVAKDTKAKKHLLA
jgi:hypothetical protein